MTNRPDRAEDDLAGKWVVQRQRGEEERASLEEYQHFKAMRNRPDEPEVL